MNRIPESDKPNLNSTSDDLPASASTDAGRDKAFDSKGVSGSSASAAKVADYSKTAVLLLNLGSPAEPTAAALKPYLRQFLSDRRVIEVNPLLWSFILNVFIVPFRSAKSAERYRLIWMKEGSPLIVYTERLARKLQTALEKTYPGLRVRYGMRYGEPDQEKVFRELHEKEGVEKIIVLPLYPQYSATTTASAHDAIGKALAKMRSQPQVHFIRDFHDRADYIKAVADSVRALWKEKGELPENARLVFSFHGMPQRYIDLGDPYAEQVRRSVRMIIEELGVEPQKVVTTFQSRFGREAWLKPYLSQALTELAREGVERVDVVCPGFSIDCLETLEEIAQESKDIFLSAGGKAFHYIPCLNDSDASVELASKLLEKPLSHL